MRPTTILTALIVATLAILPSNSRAQHEGHGAQGDSTAVAGVIAKYHEALAAGDWSSRQRALGSSLSPVVAQLETRR